MLLLLLQVLVPACLSLLCRYAQCWKLARSVHGVLGVDGDLLLLAGQERRGPVEKVVEVMDKVSSESEDQWW